jgi:hypothetical protein
MRTALSLALASACACGGRAATGSVAGVDGGAVGSSGSFGPGDSAAAEAAAAPYPDAGGAVVVGMDGGSGTLLDSGTPHGLTISCGAATCQVPQACCTEWSPPPPCPLGEACDPSPPTRTCESDAAELAQCWETFACSGPTDCANGLVCCATPGPDAGTLPVHITARCKTSCGPADIQVCATDTDCPAGQHCTACVGPAGSRCADFFSITIPRSCH